MLVVTKKAHNNPSYGMDRHNRLKTSFQGNKPKPPLLSVRLVLQSVPLRERRDSLLIVPSKNIFTNHIAALRR
ncbi:9502_t:CDS:2 [Dentiscutata erythropus]|uniref:9502_t:CDS:1 n=1 Tax=Dentiscutata erythropus TaxID=1348616 RepID=A0A9N8WIB7_9GLOM|nr:9502_t:CDS:2 [Dentiscutata erythropus]